MKQIKSIVLCLIATIITAFFAGCSTQFDPPPATENPRIILGIEGNSVAIDISTGSKTLDLEIKTTGADGGFTTRSDNYSVASVNEKGIVTAKHNGVANVYIEANGAESVKVEVTVTGEPQTEIEYPEKIENSFTASGHVQGIAIDYDRKYIYYTFADKFVKTDILGNVVGWFDGYQGHLGDCTYNVRDGKVYASLYCRKGEYGWTAKSTSYIAVIDVDKIVKADMDAYRDEIMKTVYLQAFLDDYYQDLDGNGVVSDNYTSDDRKYGVVGIDGICFGPKFGEKGGKQYLTIAYAIAKCESRIDNDYQVFLQYDVDDWYRYGESLNVMSPHKNGPKELDGKYFLYTGNTDFGIQTMDYDEKNNFWVCVAYNYKKASDGLKKDFDHDGIGDTTFLIDNSVKPKKELLKGQPEDTYGNVLSFVRKGRYNDKADIYSWCFWIGNTGIVFLGNDLYYVAEHKAENGICKATAVLYRYTGTTTISRDGNDCFEKVS
mgnify:CR=1 FL=1